jgi:tRNA threonylcarbamoyl adenosine modification protein YeaZ
MNAFTLSIEAAIATGSLSISNCEGEIDRSFGNRHLGRTESLLSEISLLLHRNDLNPGDLSQIVVSLGPGSYTGMKIGIATAIGLSRAASIECVGVAATEAMLELSVGGLDSICAIPIGRDMVCEHRFDSSQIERYQPRVTSISDLVKTVSQQDCELIAHQHLLEQFSQSSVRRLINAGQNIAGLITRRLLRKRPTRLLNPVFAKAA